MLRPTVFVCHGGTCRHEKGFDELRERLRAVADISEVRCQRICDGPVVGAAVNGSLEWFERVRSEKVQTHLVDLVAGSGRLRKSLEKRRVAKRAGRLR
jgi:hypothetical protein